MKKTLLIVFTFFALSLVNGQFIKEQSIDVSIGLGLSAPYDDVNIVATGFYLQGEYVLVLTKWIDIRPYAGLILTKSNGKDMNDNPSIYRSTSKAFLMGGKTRIKAPIPWVAPYVEVGIGTSIGAFETVTPFTDIDKSGLVLHIPFSLGLELGRKHNFDIAFTYYFQPSVEQYAGAVAFGLSIPLNN